MYVRHHIPDATKRAVLARDGWLCALCGGVLGCRVDFDHRVAVQLGGGNDEGNIDAVHPICHRTLKTPGDVKAIAKAKRLFNKYNGIETRRKKPIPSRPFPKTHRPFAKRRKP